jgi:FkbM family methyltransferase
VPVAFRKSVSVRKWSLRLVELARRRLFYTRLSRTRLVVWVYAKIFEAVSPDLNSPISFRGVEFLVDPDDRATVPAMVGGYYERAGLDVFSRLVDDAEVFLDVGANIGVYSILGCLTSPSLHAYAFEPVAENQRLLEYNIGSHHLEERVHLERSAVSGRAGTVTMYLNQSATHSIHERQPGATTREVEAVTIDGFVSSAGMTPDIIKIDVEGHEASVIDGALNTLAAHSPTVFIEYIPIAHNDVESFVERLMALSATCFVIDEIHGHIRELPTSELDRRKGYNLILAPRSAHAETIRRVLNA